MLNFVKNCKWFLLVSACIVAVGLVCFIANRGFVEDVDFAGGTTMYIDMGESYDAQSGQQELQDLIKETLPDLVNPTVQRSDGNQVVIKTTPIETEARDKLTSAIIEKYGLTDAALLQVDNVSATVGQELKMQALLAAVIAALLMLVYITVRFEFKSGVAAVCALLHDVLIMLSVYAIFRVPINNSFIAAILTIIGYSINATIVVFDRVRENRKKNRRGSFDETVNVSVKQTLARSINTTVTTLLTVVMLYILGVSAIREFAFPLIVGLLSGAYSSVFLASPIWAALHRASAKRKDKKRKVRTA